MRRTALLASPRPRRALAAIAACATALLPAAPALAAGGPGGSGGGMGGRAAGAAGGYDDPGQARNILPPGSNGNATLLPTAKLLGENLPDILKSLRNPSGLKAAATTATPTTPPHYADALERYDDLNTVPPKEITQQTVDRDYKDESLDPDHVASVEHPKAGVTIKRDDHDVPFVYGKTAADVAYGAGYAGIEDRMFLTDLLRHVGSARMAGFLGATDANVAMDQSTLRSQAYTHAEAAAQIGKAVDRFKGSFPKRSARLLKKAHAFIAGINAAQHKLCPVAFGLSAGPQTGLGVGLNCPVEYVALQKKPTDYDLADLVYIASLVGGIFGKGGGEEYANAQWYEKLKAKYGEHTAIQIYNDLREKNDPEAPTTLHGVDFPYGHPHQGLRPDQPGVALPDLHPTATAPGTGAMITRKGLNGSGLPLPGAGGALSASASPGSSSGPLGVVDGPFGKIDLRGLLDGLAGHSNALVVDAAHSTSGHPTVVFGPQTGYYTPQLLTEIALHGPHEAARGVSFAGTQLVVELGRGVDYAWSATSASDDNVDTVIEKLCDPGGGTATVNSTYYVDNSSGADKCVKMERYVHTETAIPTLGGLALPKRLKMLVLKTRHGIVQLRTTVDGKPVAVVSQRSTYGHEIDSIGGFAFTNDPHFVHDPASFMQAFDRVDFDFNWFYADSKHIAYFNSALLPRRAPGVDYDLPRWGAAKYDWQGFLGFDRHARQTDPRTGFFVSWNNKPSPGLSANDAKWGEGSIYRSQMLSDRVKALLHSGDHKITKAELTGAMMGAATQDLRGAYLLPTVLDVIGTNGLTKQQAAAVKLLRDWISDGAHRVDRDRSGHYPHQAAIALFDEWWESQAANPDNSGTFALPKAVLRGTLGDLVDELPQGLDDHPRIGRGSAWNGVAWYGYVDKDLRRILGRPETGKYSRVYCGEGSLTQCRADLRTSLSDAIKRAEAKHGASSVDALTYDKTDDDIVPVTAGLVGVRPIDWQNRPTFQQVVMFTSHRPEQTSESKSPEGTAAGGPAPSHGSSGKPSRRSAEASAATLAATGASAWAPAAGAALALAVLAGVAVRRRRGCAR